VLGLRLWVLVGIAVGAAFVLLLVLISLHLASARRRRPRKGVAHAPAGAAPAPLSPSTIPPVSKEIQEVAVHVGSLRHYLEMGHAFLKDGGGDSESVAHGSQRVHIEAGKGHRMVAYADGEVGPVASDVSAAAAVVVGPEVSHLGWGHWYTLRELEEATAAFAPEHVVGEGGYGIVYRGVLADGYQVAVKNLLNNRRALPLKKNPHLLACASPFGVRSLLFFLIDPHVARWMQGTSRAGVQGGGGGHRPRPAQESGPATGLLRRGRPAVQKQNPLRCALMTAA